jgi:hypothetical protein
MSPAYRTKISKYGSYLNSLVGLCKGPIDSISDVKLNSQVWSTYPEVAIEYRYGYNNQPPSSNFNDTLTLVSGYSFPITVDHSGPETVETNTAAFDQMYVVLSFPNGIYSTSPGGDIVQGYIRINIEYKKVTDSTWTSIFTSGWEYIRQAKNKQLYYTCQAVNTTGIDEYEFRVTKLTDTDIEMQIESVYLVNTDDFQYPGIATVSIKAFDTENLNGSFDFSCVVKGKKVWVYNGEKEINIDEIVKESK